MDVGNGREPQQGQLFDPVIEAQPQADEEDVQELDTTASNDRVAVNAVKDTAFLQSLTR